MEKKKGKRERERSEQHICRYTYTPFSLFFTLLLALLVLLLLLVLLRGEEQRKMEKVNKSSRPARGEESSGEK